MSKSTHPATQMIHVGAVPDASSAAVAPLYDSTTFSFDSTADLLDVVEGRTEAAFYTRYGMNPTIQSLEQRLAALDKADKALAYASGMAAISSLCLAFGRGGIICMGEIYGGTTGFLNQAAQLGIETRFIASKDKVALEQGLSEGASLVLFETPANPTLSVTDIAEVAELAHQFDALVAVDNTFATPINQLPLQLGADLAVQSATKYLGGHSDLTAGVVTGDGALITSLNPWRSSLGQTIAPETAHKLKRSLITLPLRVAQHNQNALTVAEFLQQHASVDQVFYPGLITDPGHPLAKKQMSGFGGMLSFTVKGGGHKARQMIDGLTLIKRAPSLGGAESLATQPVFTSHHGLPEALLKKAGISASMIRLSVGLEQSDDLIEDLQQALSNVALHR
ncbi:aminotransferase class I/II-fold pyridoxal phosphate-dependent enzyme [uncultured Methylophaga sp.]|uniref:trans-sulfuration enzyme family protein n=1 Tax=uncultured Methylophaga sp. TaxID=285271 RepID=UPI002603ADC5|nr:aminotransferase class I/II-fold pyridoxal phosphate-dependent enzyme [uncultured Methylophaga sp.]